MPLSLQAVCDLPDGSGLDSLQLWKQPSDHLTCLKNQPEVEKIKIKKKLKTGRKFC